MDRYKIDFLPDNWEIESVKVYLTFLGVPIQLITCSTDMWHSIEYIFAATVNGKEFMVSCALTPMEAKGYTKGKLRKTVGASAQIMEWIRNEQSRTYMPEMS